MFRSVYRFRFAKKLISPNQNWSIRLELKFQATLYVVHESFFANQKNSCAHLTFCFFNRI